MILSEITIKEKSKINKLVIIDQKNSSLSVIMNMSIIVIMCVLFSQLICSDINPVFNQQIYAENPDVIESINEDHPVNNTKLSTNYHTLLTNNYPYPIRFTQNAEKGAAIIHDGIVMSKNSKSEELSFTKWGFPNNLNLYNFSGPNENITLFYIDGNTSDNAAGFMSAPIRSNERYISINLGSIYKDPNTAQTTIQLNVVGDKNKYQLDFVNGRLGHEGWLENSYYKQISTNSSNLIDLAELISLRGDRYSYLEGVNIIIEKYTQIGILQFRIDLGNSTVNLPALVNYGQSYFVNAHLFQGIPLLNEYKFLFDDWRFKQILDQEFVINQSDDFDVATNNWNILEMSKSKDNSSNKMHVKILSEKTFMLWDLPILEVVTHLDVYDSIISFGSTKDILFVVIILILVVSVFYKSKNIAVANKSANLK